ncbi:hypothetical protein BGX26_011453, partial [Mortierella sp. AD094]
MSEEPLVDTTFPTVLVVGGGLGGLLLGAVLESANISYHILERATEARPLGSAIGLTGNILPVFEQLGILEDLKRISLPHVSLDFFDIDRSKLGAWSTIARPKLYELLRKQVPDHKISMGKKVLRTKEHDNKVTVFCSDNTTYECSILVGADGAYSAVRQNMYSQLEEEGKLPLCDNDGFSIGYVTMVGVSTPTDPEKHPELKNDHAQFRSLLGVNHESAVVITVPNNEICWRVSVQLAEPEAKEQHFRNSEWGPEAIDATLRQFEDFPCALGGTMKELFEATPRHLISRVFLEEKVFKTWYHGRSVLIGDACHKMLPAAGQGAVMAMKDAVVLANCIYNMNDTSSESINTAFENYFRQRYTEAEIQLKNSNDMSKMMSGQ